MLETTGLGERIASLLSDSADWRDHAFCLSGAVALVEAETGLLFDIQNGAVSCLPADEHATRAARVRITADASGWQRLGDPTEINATLNRLFREGDLDVVGDMDFVMHHWAGLFWMISAVRAALLETPRGRRPNPAEGATTCLT